MNRKLKRLTAAAASVGAAMMLSAAGMLHVSAEGSVEDVYEAMRRIGMDFMIPNAKSQYQNTPHDANGMTINGHYYTYDVWVDMIEIYEDDIWDEVAKEFGMTGEELKKSKQTTPSPATTTTGNGSGGTVTTTTTATTAKVTNAAGKTFIQMTLEEKKAYVASLPPEERAAFIANLSNAERNSILKQMDPASQANVMQSFVKAGEDLGLHITVDDIGSGNGISYSVRDSEGKLIDATSIGAGVDDTGWNLTVPVLAAAGTLVVSVTGLVWLAMRSGTKQTKKEHDTDAGTE